MSVALADIGERDVPRLPTRHRRAGSCPRRRASSRDRSILVGGEPGIGKSTLLLQVAAGVGPPGPVRDRRGIGRPGPPARRPARASWPGHPARPIAGPCRARHRSGSSRWPGRPDRPCVIVDSIQTATVDELDGAAGSVGQVREAAVRLMEFAKGEGDRRRPRRARHQGRLDRRARRRSSTWSTRSSPWRASATPRCASSGPPRTGSARPRRSVCSRWPGPACWRSAIRPGPSSPITPSRRPAASSPRRSRAAGRSSSRSRRSSRRPATGPPLARPAASIRTGSGLLVAVLGERAGIGLGVPRRLREPGRRAVRRRARPGPARRPGPRLVPARSTDRARDRRDRRGRAAWRAARRDRSGATASGGGPPGLHRGDRAPARPWRRPADRPRPAASSRSPRCATPSQAALASGADRRGDALPAMLG